MRHIVCVCVCVYVCVTVHVCVCYSSKLKQAALQTLFSLARSYPEKCHWEEHFQPTLTQLLECISCAEDGAVRALSVRTLREMLKTEHKRFSEYAEITTLRILSAFADSDASVRTYNLFFLPRS